MSQRNCLANATKTAAGRACSPVPPVTSTSVRKPDPSMMTGAGPAGAACAGRDGWGAAPVWSAPRGSRPPRGGAGKPHHRRLVLQHIGQLGQYAADMLVGAGGDSDD